jgi:hypothetical protein
LVNRFAAWVLAAIVAAWSARAYAELPKAAVLAPTPSNAVLASLAGAVERILRADVDALQVVHTEGTPALKLAELQLAVGCVGETRACLEAIAVELEVDILILSNVDETGAERLVSLTLFDKRKGGDAERVVRRASGAKADAELLDGIDGMLRELFKLPPPPPKKDLLVDTTPPNREEPRSVLPFVVGGAGAAALVAGAIVGLIFNGTKNDYASASIMGTADVDHALTLKSRADREATAANVLLVVGAVGLAAGAALFFVQGGGG